MKNLKSTIKNLLWSVAAVIKITGTIGLYFAYALTSKKAVNA